MENQRKVILYIAMSLDGFIAGENDDLSFLSAVEKEGEDYGYNDFIAGVDTVVLGRRTYDWVMGQVPEFPHKDKETYVITRRPQPAEGNVVFYTGDVKTLLARLSSQPGKNIFIDGGAALVNTLLQHQLIDEMIISVIPVLLGRGVRLFRDDNPGAALNLLGCKSFEKGLVQLHYVRS